MKKLPLHVHKKTAKGRAYYYYDGPDGLIRLPDIRAKDFGSAYATANAQRSKRRSSAKTFDWLVKLYEHSPEFRKLAPASQDSYSRHLGYANANFRNRHGKSAPLNILSAEQVIALRDKYGEQTGTANAILSALGSLYAWAMKPGRRYASENIVAGVDFLEKGEHQPWPVELLEEALADPEIRLPVALLYFLGQRLGDTVKLGRPNLSAGIVTLTQQKTGTALNIPVHDRLARIIESDVPKTQLLFLLNASGKAASGSAIRHRIQAWAKERGHHVVPHGLRKNAVNALLQAGCSGAEVSAITGQTMQTVEHYAKQRNRDALGRSAIIKFQRRNGKRT